MARLKRFELLTARFVAEYSIQLSYRRIISLKSEAQILLIFYPLVNAKICLKRYFLVLFKSAIHSGLNMNQKNFAILLSIIFILLFLSPFSSWWSRLDWPWYLPYLLWFSIILAALFSSRLKAK